MGRPITEKENSRPALHLGERPFCDWCGKVLMHPRQQGRKRDTCSRSCKERRLRQDAKLRSALSELKSSRKEMTGKEDSRLTRLLKTIILHPIPNVR